MPQYTMATQTNTGASDHREALMKKRATKATAQRPYLDGLESQIITY